MKRATKAAKATATRLMGIVREIYKAEKANDEAAEKSASEKLRLAGESLSDAEVETAIMAAKDGDRGRIWAALVEAGWEPASWEAPVHKAHLARCLELALEAGAHGIALQFAERLFLPNGKATPVPDRRAALTKG